MTYQKMLGKYKKLNVETAGKLDLVLMCYEKAIELLRQALDCYKDGRYEMKARKLRKVMDIIQQLQGCLNHEKGGQIANNLSALYTYLIKRILQGDIRKDHKALEEVIRILSDLKEAWQEIASGQQEQPRPGIAPVPGEKTLEQLAA